MSEAIPCPFTDLFKAIEGGSKKKLKQTIQSLQPLLESTDTDTTAALENDENPLKDTNLIILCCKFGHLNILHYFLNRGKQFIDSLYNDTRANVLSPSDRDEEGHNAFYYAIRSNNVEIVQLLLTNWLPSFDESVPRKDSLLSEAYKELKLRNVSLTEEMEFFVESEIIASRFQSNIDDRRVQNSRNDLFGRIDWLLSNIDSLKTMEVESGFLLLAKCIAQNLHILKHQLKSTYDVIPWEEMEFCLITCIASKLRTQERSIVPLVSVTKEALLGQLSCFSTILKNISLQDVLRPNKFPNITEKEVIAPVSKNNSPELYKLLYENYQTVRNIYSLEKIEEYLKSSFSVNYKEKPGQLAIIRILQVLSDFLKKTPDSCKLSEAISRVILTALPEKTKNIVIELRNTESQTDSLKKRLEIEGKDTRFFKDVQMCLKYLSGVVSRILNYEKLRIMSDLFEKIIESDNVEEVRVLGKNITCALKCIDIKDFKIYEEEKIKMLINILKIVMSSSIFSESESQLFSDVMSSLSKGPTASDLVQVLPEVLGVSVVQCFDKFKSFDGKLNIRDLQIIRSVARLSLSSLLPPSHIDKMSKVFEFAKEVAKTVKGKSHDLADWQLKEIDRLLFEISFAATVNVEDVLFLRSAQDPLDSSSKMLMSETERKHILESKLAVLKNMIGSNGKIDVLRLATEILLLDVSTIRDWATCDSDNIILDVEDSTPVLVGKCLRSYLAHSSALIEIFPTDPATAIVSNAIQLISGENSTDSKKIVNFLYDDVSGAKEKLNKNMEVVIYQDELFRALEKGDQEKSLSIIKFGADVFGRSVCHESALHFAAKSQNFDLAKLILARNVLTDLADEQGRTALHVAAEHGNITLIEHVVRNFANVDLNKKDKNGRTFLHVAAQHGEAETVALLINLGAEISAMDLNKRTPLFLAVESNSVTAVESLLAHGTKMDGFEDIGRLTPLHLAAEYNRVDILKLMLAKGVDVDLHNDYISTPLKVAAENNSVEAAEILIDAGANVNPWYSSEEIYTPLHYAAELGHTGVAEVLLQNGADVNTAQFTNKPIHSAAGIPQLEMLELLIQYKAELNCRNSNGSAPIHCAAQQGHAKVIEILLKAGVDIESEDERGSTALQLSTSHGCLEATRLLIEKGARSDAATLQ